MIQSARRVGKSRYATFLPLALALLTGAGCSGSSNADLGGPGPAGMDMAGPGGPQDGFGPVPGTSTAFEFEHPLPQGNTLRAVWSDGTHSYAVGELGAIVHLSDRGAAREAVGLTVSTLTAVTGRGGDVWAAGSDGVVVHGSGGSWSAQRVSPGPLYAIWLQGDTVYAAGAGTQVYSGGDKGFQSATLPGFGATAAVRGAAVTGDEVYLVGSGGRILHSVSKRWFLEADGLTTVDLNAVTVTGSGVVYVVGVGARILRKDPKGWTLDQPQPPLTRAPLVAVFSVGAEVYAVAEDGTVLHRVDTGWQKDVDHIAPGRITHAFGTAKGAVAVGESGLLLTRGAGKPDPWQSAVAGSPITLSGVTAIAALADGTAYATTQDGLVLRRTVNNGTPAWSKDYSPMGAKPQTLLAVAARGDDVYAVGMNGLILHRTSNGKGWQSEDAAIPDHRPDFKGVAIRSATDVYIVGGSSSDMNEVQSVVLHKTGGAWLRDKADFTESLYAVAAGDSAVIAVGPRGTILLRRDMGWAREAEHIADDVELLAITAAGAEFHAAGTRGAVLHRDGSGKWTKELLPDALNSLDAIAIAGTDLWVVGSEGLAARRGADLKWSRQPTLSTSYLSGLAVSGDDLLTGGSGGAILRRNLKK